jgi:serine/tyrosine/threonine adenylyltransferase
MDFKNISCDDPFFKLGNDFSLPIETSPLSDPYLIHINSQSEQLLGIEGPVDDDSWTKLINGEIKLGETPRCSFYSGHQFGHWAGRLGDGRAHTLGQIGDYELQIKGAGLTPFSRTADGRAVLRSTIREYLASEYMHALNIPTTRSLGIIGSSTVVMRERPEEGAAMIRLSPSFTRFGTVEYLKSEKKREEIEKLLFYLRENFYSEVSSHSELVQAIGKRTAETIARWMAYGFCHGVMNTDNMSLLGLTIDYGPYGFLENYDTRHICNHSDTYGRYSFGSQPNIGLWNIGKLAEALEDFLSDKDFEDIGDIYTKSFNNQYWFCMSERLGISMGEEAHEWVKQFFTKIEGKYDFNIILRDLSEGKNEVLKILGLNESYQSLVDKNLQKKMEKVNPKYVLRNWIAQDIINSVEGKDYTKIDKALHILQNPYQEHSELTEYLKETPEWGKCLSISCSS